MPEHLLSLFIIKGDQLEQAVSLQRAGHIDQLIFTLFVGFLFSLRTDHVVVERGFIPLGVFDSGDDGCLSEVLGDALGDQVGSGKEGLALDFLAVFELSEEGLTVTVISGFSSFS